jgi:hypothetical protein
MADKPRTIISFYSRKAVPTGVEVTLVSLDEQGTPSFRSLYSHQDISADPGDAERKMDLLLAREKKELPHLLDAPVICDEMAKTHLIWARETTSLRHLEPPTSAVVDEFIKPAEKQLDDSFDRVHDTLTSHPDYHAIREQEGPMEELDISNAMTGFYKSKFDLVKSVRKTLEAKAQNRQRAEYAPLPDPEETLSR